MSSRSWILLGLLGLAAALVAWAFWSKAQPEATANVQLERRTAVDGESSPARLESPPEKAAPPESGPGPAPITFRGTVVDIHGAPQANVAIGIEGAAPVEALAKSAPDGRFEILVEYAGATLIATDVGVFTARSLVIESSDSQRENELVIAPAVDLSGFVVDRAGRGLEGDIVLNLPDSAFARVPDDVQGRLLQVYRCRSDFQGRFRLASVPEVPGAFLVAVAKAHLANRVTLAEGSSDALRIVLRRMGDGKPLLHGVVLHHDGSPARGATVVLDQQTTYADAKGEFILVLDSVPADASLFAIARGHQPVILQRYGEVVRGALGDQGPVTLILGPPALSIRGKVLDEEGKPGVDWLVSLVDPTVMPRGHWRFFEDLCSEDDGSWSPEKGVFVLSGLADRSYTLQAVHLHTMLKLVSDPIRAGKQDVVLQVPFRALIESLRGKVCTPDGQPLANVDVRSFLVEREGAVLGDSYRTGRYGPQKGITSEDGAFELRGIPRRFVELVMTGESIIPARMPVESVDVESNLPLVVQRRAQFRLDAWHGDGPPPDSLRLLDPHGRSERLFREIPRGTDYYQGELRISLRRDPERTFIAAEGRHTLVLEHKDGEIARREIELVAGEVTIVHR